MIQARKYSALKMVASVVVAQLLSVVASADEGREIRPKNWQEDATINDTFWIDDQYAWAVGDQGLILRTTDGGQTWLSSESAGLDLDDNRSLEQKLANPRPLSQTNELMQLTCSFKSVCFVDRKRGWVAGNFHVPYLESTRSVMLWTGDGGKSWSELKGSLLPEINRIVFQDVLGGWALGRSGHLFNTGVFSTSTGGRNWSVTDSDNRSNWIDGELVAGGLIVIDDEGNLGRITSGRYEAAVIFGDRPGFLHAVRMFDSKIGWAVGKSGTVLQTSDGGQTWRRPKTDGTTNPFASFDFKTVAVVGEKVVFAGSPGTKVFEMNAETARELISHDTNFNLPVQKIFFSSPENGCLVGANGLIAASTNGGISWEVQRRANDRLAVLSVNDNPVSYTHLTLPTIYSV